MKSPFLSRVESALEDSWEREHGRYHARKPRGPRKGLLLIAPPEGRFVPMNPDAEIPDDERTDTDY